MPAAPERTPGRKFAVAVLLGVLLSLPLLIVYMLIYGREQQSQVARSSIVEGWGAEQTLAGPFLVVPFEQLIETTTAGKTSYERRRRELTIAPIAVTIDTRLDPERRQRSIYEAVVYRAVVRSSGRFVLPDFAAMGIATDALRLGEAEIRFGISSAKGLGGSQPRVVVDGRTLPLIPGSGLALTNNSGFLGVVGAAALADRAADFAIAFDVQGNDRISLIPTAQDTVWTMRSSWPSPSFVGGFLPIERRVDDGGFSARWRIGNLALNRPVVSFDAPRPGSNDIVTVALIDPVDLYDQVGRATKYGALFVGFTFLTLLMFDVIGGVRVAGVAYFLVGIGLILFFVLLLALAEVIGFLPAYLLASAAILGLIIAYTGAVLGSWRRAGVLGGILASLYVVLYILLSLEAYSLLIGASLLFAALALVMYATRRIDWSAVQRTAEPG